MKIKIITVYSWGKSKPKDYSSLKTASQHKRRYPNDKFECTIDDEEFVLIGQKPYSKRQVQKILDNWEKEKY